MARARHPRREWGDDGQGGRRPYPYAQDQGLARGRAPRGAQVPHPARQSRRPAGIVSLAHAGGPRRLRGACAERAHLHGPPRRGGRARRPSRLPPRHETTDQALGRARRRHRERQNLKSGPAARAAAVPRGGHVKVYTYFRSSAAYRLRIALNLKGLSGDMVSIHLQKDGGLNRKPEYRAINPQMRVPALRLDSGEVLTQSLAIIEYLDEVDPQPPLLPRDPVERAKVRALALAIACDIHPLNNISPLRYLKNVLGQDQSKIDAWYHHWVLEGFEALETMVRPGPYAFGGEVTLADVCLVPQIYNARRLKVPLERFPKLVAIDAACAKLPAFEQARPENQPDAE